MFATYLYWFTIAFGWYVTTLAFALLSTPLTSLLFKDWFDKGYAFSRALGIILVTYITFVLINIHLATFSLFTCYIILGSYLLINVCIQRKYKTSLPAPKIIFFYEILFFGSFIFWSYVKAHEPTIRSLEKYMDFGFIQSILNSTYLPPQDPWFASTSTFFSINYYYFGHFITAFLIKLSGTIPSVGYNLMLSTILAISVTSTFSLCASLFRFLIGKRHVGFSELKFTLLTGFIGSYLLNFGGNLHPLYLFTKGYQPENPVPFWSILSWFNPKGYWYPNATRFIPFTIHEFPSYSYVVSDLHGHVLNIPFVLLLLALFVGYLVYESKKINHIFEVLFALLLGTSYMTNSTDLLVYGTLLFFVLVIKYQTLLPVIVRYAFILGGALIFAAPFSIHFKPFATGLGLNCAPDFLIHLKRFGPLLFEQDKCQTSPFWMLFILWGFFWLSFCLFLGFIFFRKHSVSPLVNRIIYFIFFAFVHSLLLTLFAEFFYFKDIYPAHFRANTMFKLGYQAFMIMSILSVVAIVYSIATQIRHVIKKILFLLFLLPLILILSIYPLFSIPSYFGSINPFDKQFKTLDGTMWIKKAYPELYDIIQIINVKKKKSKTPFSLLEAHGDSYTDYNVVSAHTGVPTIVGWPVHEWLWRGSYDVVRPRAEQIRNMYEWDEKKIPQIKKIIRLYNIRYVIIGTFEREKYPLLDKKKFNKIGEIIYHKNNTILYKINKE